MMMTPDPACSSSTSATPVPRPVISIPPLTQFFFAICDFIAPAINEDVELSLIVMSIAALEDIIPSLTKYGRIGGIPPK